MKSQKLSYHAQEIIKDYLDLPFPKNDVACPYYNNRRAGARGALRVHAGKGNPDDIIEEALIISMREKVNLRNLDDVDLKKFLVDHNLGIDCSGFAYYTLAAELKARHKGRLDKYLHRPWIKNPLRKIIAKLRPIENTGVATFASVKNSHKITLEKVKPGDIITMLDTGVKHDLHHLLVIYQVDLEDHKPITLHYIHCLQWTSDGQYNHGVRKGKIQIKDLNKDLLEQNWIEANQTGEKNETYTRAKTAEKLELKRLYCLD